MPNAALAALRVLRAMPVPVWIVPMLVLGVAPGAALRAAAWITSLLEDLGGQWSFSSGLLGFIGALGANMPNHGASLAAFAGGHGPLGLGIILASNSYNLTIILGLVTFATPGRHGISLTLAALRDVRRVACVVAAMGMTTGITLHLLTAPASWPKSALPLPPDTLLVAAQVVNVLSVDLFTGLKRVW